MKFQLGFLIFFALVLVAVAEDRPAEKVCEAGKEFTKDCSACKCNAEGTEYTCEKKDCPASQKVSEAPSVNVAEAKCTPGETFKNRCNECKCPESGLKSQAACTVLSCPDD